MGKKLFLLNREKHDALKPTNIFLRVKTLILNQSKYPRKAYLVKWGFIYIYITMEVEKEYDFKKKQLNNNKDHDTCFIVVSFRVFIIVMIVFCILFGRNKMYRVKYSCQVRCYRCNLWSSLTKVIYNILFINKKLLLSYMIHMVLWCNVNIALLFARFS